MPAVPLDVNRTDDMGYHPLHHAAANNFARVGEALLRCPRVLGDRVNMYGATPEVVARRTGHGALADVIAHKVSYLGLDVWVSAWGGWRMTQLVCTTRTALVFIAPAPMCTGGGEWALGAAEGHMGGAVRPAGQDMSVLSKERSWCNCNASWLLVHSVRDLPSPRE